MVPMKLRPPLARRVTTVDRGRAAMTMVVERGNRMIRPRTAGTQPTFTPSQLPPEGTTTAIEHTA